MLNLLLNIFGIDYLVKFLNQLFIGFMKSKVCSCEKLVLQFFTVTLSSVKSSLFTAINLV